MTARLTPEDRPPDTAAVVVRFNDHYTEIMTDLTNHETAQWLRTVADRLDADTGLERLQ